MVGFGVPVGDRLMWEGDSEKSGILVIHGASCETFSLPSLGVKA
jgi:hypothetical protein